MRFNSIFKMIVLLIFVSLGVVYLMPQNVSAEGKMIIKPSITPGWLYDSNYYRSEKGERAVSTYSIKPGITMGYETSKSKFDLKGFLDFQRYEDEDGIPAGELGTDEDNYTEQMLGVNAESQMFDRLLLGLDANYMYTRDPVNADNYSNTTERKKYITNKVSPKLVYRFGEKFGIHSAYTNSLMDYDSSDSEDSTENRGKFDLFYNFNTTTSFDLDYQVWSRDYDITTSDYTSNQLMFNMIRKYKYFSVGGGVGYQDRSFDNDSLENIDALAWKISLNGQSGGANSDEPSRSRMMISLSQNLNDLGTTGEGYYTAKRLDAMFSRLIMEKLDASIKGYFQNSDYELTTRDDDTWNVAAGLQYMMRDWIILGIESGYENRDSNYEGKNYDDTYVMLNAEFNYNLGSR